FFINYFQGASYMDIYTIGHSTHSIEFFLELLLNNNIEVLADVRAFPGSRKFPQFKQSNIKKSLKEKRIDYEYLPFLGGRRNKSLNFQEELNEAWNNRSFHNYADYTLTPSFQKGLDRLKSIAKKKRTAYCCSECHPSRCHRLLISNSLTADGWNVYHIIPQENGARTLEKHK